MKKAKPSMLTEKRILLIKPQRVSVEDTEKILNEVKGKYPGAKISLVANLLRWDYERLYQNKIIDEKLFYCSVIKKLGIWEKTKLLFNLPTRKYDLAIVLIAQPEYLGNREARILANLSGTREVSYSYTSGKNKPIHSENILQYILFSFLSIISLFLIVTFFLIYVVGNIKLRKLIYRLRHT